MNPLLILALVAATAASYFVVLRFFKPRAYVLVIMTIIWVIILGYPWLYFISPASASYVKTFINPSEEHVVMGEEQLSLPLPRATAFRTRFDMEASQYYSRLSPRQVLEFYRSQLFGATVQSSTESQVDFLYEGTEYSVQVSPSGKSSSYVLVIVNP